MSGLTQIDGQRQIEDLSVNRGKLLADFLGGSNWNITDSNNDFTITGLVAGSAANDAVNYAQMNSAIAAAISGSMSYKGTIDASVATGVALDGASTGDFFLVSVAGTLDGIAYSVGDHLVVNADITDFSVDGSGKIDIIDNTEAADILRTSDVVNDLTTGGTTVPLSAEQGKVLKDKQDLMVIEIDAIETGAGLDTDGTYISPSGTNYIDAATSLANADALLDAQVGTNATNIGTNDTDILALQNAIADRVFGEQPTVTNGSPVLGAFANIPVDAGTAQVYVNGMRQALGLDYSIVEATGIVTFTYNLKDPKDTVVVDYEY